VQVLSSESPTRHVVHVDATAGFTEEAKALLEGPEELVGRRDQ